MDPAPQVFDPYDTPDLWREAAVRPRRTVGRRERQRLRAITLRLEWVRIDSCRRAFAENLVWWAEEHLDHPAQRLWLARRWTLNRAHGLARRARKNEDLARAFAGDLRRFAHKLAEEGERPAEGAAEREFLLLWAKLHDDRDKLPDLEAVLNRFLSAEPGNFAAVVERLVRLDQQAEFVSRHQHEPKRILFFKEERIAWFLDRAASCPVEASWMGHCGNRAAPREGDRLLSLRRRRKRGGVECWDPLLTGVLDADGMLVELKAERNTRPSAKLNHWIAWLFAHPKVRGVKLGTRALPQNDFDFWDLSLRLQRWLRERRPELLVRCADGNIKSLEKLVLAPPPPPPRPTWKDHLAWVPTAAAAAGMVIGGLFAYSLLLIVLEGAILILRDSLR